MEMNKEWADKLASDNIKWEDAGDRIIFYDPEEMPSHVVIREHIKDDSKNPAGGYYSHRIGKMTFEEFKERFK